mgnify:CR=1 FL=1
MNQKVFSTTDSHNRKVVIFNHYILKIQQFFMCYILPTFYSAIQILTRFSSGVLYG